jgi:hypothetical protein
VFFLIYYYYLKQEVIGDYVFIFLLDHGLKNGFVRYRTKKKKVDLYCVRVT